jgi:hypothetical protein
MKETILATIITTTLGLASLYARQETILGSGHVVEASRDVSDFNSVAMRGGWTLRIRQGDTESLTITAEDNLIPYFVTEVVGQKLVIRAKNVSLRVTKPVIFDLEVKNLREVELSGSSDISAPNLHVRQFSLVVSGSGTVKMPNLHGNELTVSLSGSGNVVCSGEVDRQVINIAGRGNYEAANLANRKTEIVIRGAGKAEIHVLDDLDAQISGAGKVRYHGNPKNVRTRVTGVGAITHVD